MVVILGQQYNIGEKPTIIILFLFFPVQQTTSGIGHRVNKVGFFRLATNALNVRNNKVLYLQPLIPPKRFDIFPPITGRYPE